MVKTKGSINSPMAQLVEVALEEGGCDQVGTLSEKSSGTGADGESKEQRCTLGEK